MLLVGKRQGQSLVATSVTGQQSSSRLFYISDRSTGLQFLINTGVEVSVVPTSRTERMHRQDYLSLQAVNGTSIPTFGNRSLTLDLGLRRTFRWIFFIADVKKPILRANFFRAYKLLVDMRHSPDVLMIYRSGAAGPGVLVRLHQWLSDCQSHS